MPSPDQCLDRLTPAALRDTVAAFRAAMKEHAADINRLNVYPVPDGDTGTNMARTLDAVVAEIDAAPSLDMAATCAAISHGSLMGARGNSGVILSQVLRGLASTFRDLGDDGADAVQFAAGLVHASAAAYKAVLKPIEGTILTVVRVASEQAATVAADGASLTETVRAARVAGGEALASTPDLLPVLRDAGVVDAGGAGFLLLLDAAAHVVAGDPMPEPDVAADTDMIAGEVFQQIAKRSGIDGELDVSEQRYEVMYFLDLDDGQIESFKQAWGDLGDSIVVVGGDGIWNCHVHTNDIGGSIEVALELGGRPHKIRVTDLFEEVADEHALREAAIRAGDGAAVMAGDRHAHDVVPSPNSAVHPGLQQPAVTCAVVAVSSGDGLTELFANLGVQGVISGGQTLNPSTAELLDAVEAVNSDHVVVLPNNKNIIPVAEQLDALTSKTVVVVPTISMPEALAALIVYDPEAGAAANAEEMTDAARAVATGELTQAVRDTATDAGEVHEGDWIGIVRGDGIVAIGDSLQSAATALLGQLIDASREIVTVVEGADATSAQTESLRSWLTAEHPDIHVEVHRGGQPLYPYLFGVE